MSLTECFVFIVLDMERRAAAVKTKRSEDVNKAQVEDVAKAHAVVAELQRRLEIAEGEKMAAVEAADEAREKMHAAVHERRVAAAAAAAAAADAAVPRRQVMHVEQEELQRGKPRTSTEDFVVSRQNLASMVTQQEVVREGVQSTSAPEQVEVVRKEVQSAAAAAPAPHSVRPQAACRCL